MNLLDILWDLFRKPASVPFKDMPEITREKVREILAPFNSNIWISDGVFKLLDTNDLKNFLAKNPVNNRKYISEFHDCDDFCYELMGDVSTWNSACSFGMVWGNRAVDNVGHAWNFFINENNKIMFVEPQSDVIFAPSTEKVWLMII